MRAGRGKPGHRWQTGNAPHMQLPKDEGDYPLRLLIATKQALFRCMEDPELEDARAILAAIDATLEKEDGQLPE